MVNITHKSSTLRKAIARATVKVSSQNTIDTINNNKVPKGNIFEFAKVATLFALKKTSDIIPDCHPLPIEFAQVTYEMENLNIHVFVEVHTIYKTGVEVEAMHGASVAALVMYDMLKPIDKNVQIENIALQQKTGGKSDLKTDYSFLKTAVLVCSDTVSKGEKEDFSGKAIVQGLEKFNIKCEKIEVVPDEIDAIQKSVQRMVSEGYNLIISTGGTGLSKRDVTPEAVKPLLTREIEGIMETVRNYGQQRIKTAMLSRGVAGFIDDTLILTFAGSKNAVVESMDALFPQVLHLFEIKDGKGH